MAKSSVSTGVGIAGGHESAARSRGDVEPVEVARWRAAEGRLYPLIMVDPDAYQAVVALVGEMTVVLRVQCGTVAELTQVDGADILARCPSVPALADLGFDPAIPLDAARAGRWRELTASGPHVEPGSGSDGR